MIIRNERDLVALQAFKFAGKQLQPGEQFRAVSSHARLLVAMGRAAPVVGIETVAPAAPAAMVHTPPLEPVKIEADTADPVESQQSSAETSEQANEPQQEASQAVAAPEVAPVADAALSAPGAEQVESTANPIAATQAPAADDPTPATRARRTRGASQV